MSSIALIVFLICFGGLNGELNQNQPPHCTTVTKHTDYAAKFKLDYPQLYIPSGQREGYQQLFCVNPPQVNWATTTVCDWAAPPQVHFTLGDDYMHVVRQDPSGRYLGNAIINTNQLCAHNISYLYQDITYVPNVKVNKK